MRDGRVGSDTLAGQVADLHRLTACKPKKAVKPSWILFLFLCGCMPATRGPVTALCDKQVKASQPSFHCRVQSGAAPAQDSLLECSGQQFAPPACFLVSDSCYTRLFASSSPKRTRPATLKEVAGLRFWSNRQLRHQGGIKAAGLPGWRSDQTPSMLPCHLQQHGQQPREVQPTSCFCCCMCPLPVLPGVSACADQHAHMSSLPAYAQPAAVRSLDSAKSFSGLAVSSPPQ